MLPQSAAVAFVLAEVAVNGAVMECDPVVFIQVGTYLFGTEFAADKGVDVLNYLRIEFIGFSPVLFGQPALPLGFIGAVLLPLDAVPLDFAADGAFVVGDFGDGAVAGQVLDMVPFVLGQLCVAHGNLSCRKGRMLPHTGLFLLWKVALQMRIRRPFLYVLQIKISKLMPLRLFQHRKGKNDEVDILIVGNHRIVYITG